MLTALDAPDDKLDEAEQSFVASIREHGWFRTTVHADEGGPGFSYSTGFWLSAHHPELVMFGLKTDIAHDVFWGLFRGAKQGRELVPGRRTQDAFAHLPAYAFSVSSRCYADHLGWSRWFYCGDEFPCLQIVWPDRAGVFPWEAGFDPEFRADQPDLTERGWAAEAIP
jgi:hypothetical protein